MSNVLPPELFIDLKGGKLTSIADRVGCDDTLMLAFRGRSINIYYRGGSILRLSQRGQTGRYNAHFDDKYAKADTALLPKLPKVVANEADCQAWVDAFASLKQIMDRFFSTHRKSEREFQQMVAWENNRSGIASETEYFITDIEYATDIDYKDARKRVRLDMLGVKWLRKKGDDGSNCTPVFIEMKYGINALGGTSGINEHVCHLRKLLDSESSQFRLNQMIESQFKQLAQLGLIKLAKNKLPDKLKLTRKPEVILLLANCIPRGKALQNALATIESPSSFDLRFFVANFAGYGMHDACMVNLDKFRNRLDPTADRSAAVHQE